MKCCNSIFLNEMLLECQKPEGHKGCHFAMVDAQKDSETKKFTVIKFKIPVNWE